MMKVRLAIEVVEPNGRSYVMLGRNAIPDAALVFVAKRMANESTDQDLDDPWAIAVSTGGAFGDIKTTVDYGSGIEATISATATYVVQAGGTTGSRFLFRLNVGTSGNVLTLATASLADFGSQQSSFRVGARLNLVWMVTFAMTPAAVQGWVADSVIGDSSDPRGYIPLKEHSPIVVGSAGRTVMNVCRGLVAAPTSMTMDTYRVTNVLTDETTPPSPNDHDTELLTLVEGGVRSASIVRADKQLTWSFSVLQSTDPVSRFRDLIAVLRWGGNVVGQMGFVNRAQASSATERELIPVVAVVKEG